MYLLELAPQISKEKESKQVAVNASYQSWQLSLESYLKNLEMLGEKVIDMMRLLIAVHEHRESYAFYFKIGMAIDDVEDKLAFYQGVLSRQFSFQRHLAPKMCNCG
jgi:hypothetical protein